MWPARHVIFLFVELPGNDGHDDQDGHGEKTSMEMVDNDKDMVAIWL